MYTLLVWVIWSGTIDLILYFWKVGFFVFSLQKRILKLCSVPQGAKSIIQEFPDITILTTEVHPVAPTHFGQRYFGTDWPLNSGTTRGTLWHGSGLGGLFYASCCLLYLLSTLFFPSHWATSIKRFCIESVHSQPPTIQPGDLRPFPIGCPVTHGNSGAVSRPTARFRLQSWADSCIMQIFSVVVRWHPIRYITRCLTM